MATKTLVLTAAEKQLVVDALNQAKARRIAITASLKISKGLTLNI